MDLVDTRVEQLKIFLLAEAKSARDLWYCRGVYEGLTHYLAVFKDIEKAVKELDGSLFDDDLRLVK
jgi:hypothetical protein